MLYNAIIGFVLGLIFGLIKMPFLAYIYSLGVCIPSLAVAVRRMHDIGKSGWFLLVGLIPLIGWIWLIILYCQDSQPGDNKWGSNPKE